MPRLLGTMLASAVVHGAMPSLAEAFVPAPDRLARAVASENRTAGRQESLRFELSMDIGDRVDVGRGELVSHPSGLARLELEGAGGLLERHLLRGTERLATRNGERIGDARFFLPPVFLLQSQSGAALRAALESFGVSVDVVGLAPCGDDDCYVLGDPARAVARPPYPPIRGLEQVAGGDATAEEADLAAGIRFSDGGTLAEDREAADGAPGRSLLWIELETYEIKRLDSRSGVRVSFGPDALFGDLRVPSWIRIEEPDKSPVLFHVLQATKVNAPASAFSEDWLDMPVIPDGSAGDPAAMAP